MKYTYKGAKSVGELNSKKPNLFTSDSKFSSMSYAGGIEIVDRSISIDDNVKSKIKSINKECKFSIGSTNKNLHLYVPTADVLDGRCRVCYIIGHNDSITISQVNNPRGDKYSALYYILVEMLNNEGLKSFRGRKGDIRFNIEYEDINIFIDACKQLIELFKNDKLILMPSNEYYSINRKSQNSNYDEFYYKFYYKLKEKENSINPYKQIAKEVISVKSREELDIINNKINDINKLIQNKKLEIDVLEKI